MGIEGQTNQKIKYALHLHGWTFENGDKSALRANGKEVIPTDYETSMRNKIFCPTCCTNLQRVPHEKPYFSNGREAYFGHMQRYDHVPCVLRSKKPEGKRYDSYEEAKKAIEAEDLVIVDGFLSERPEMPESPAGEYDKTPVEDPEGPLVETPISRHKGETFPLPSKVKTVRGICRNFDANLKKYYVFKGMTFAVRLDGLLHDIQDITDEDAIPKLYYGRIRSSFAMGKKRDHNMRMTRLVCNSAVQDFTLKTTEGISRDRGLTDDSSGRIVLVFGKVTVSGMGLSIENVGWGGFDLLPMKYEVYLYP
jgi:hypothetical protein